MCIRNEYINGISNSNDRSNVDMNERPDGKGFTEDFSAQSLISIRIGNNQNSDQLMTSIEESTGKNEAIFVTKNFFFIHIDSCQLVTETQYSDVEAMECTIYCTNKFLSEYFLHI